MQFPTREPEMVASNVHQKSKFNHKDPPISNSSALYQSSSSHSTAQKRIRKKSQEPSNRLSTSTSSSFHRRLDRSSLDPIMIEPYNNQERSPTTPKNARSSRKGSMTSSHRSNLTSLPSPPPSLGFIKASQILKRESDSTRSRMEDLCGVRSPIGRVLKHWDDVGKGLRTVIILSIGIVILVKSLISLGSYSGYSDGPLFGDLEAQRHWMGLTLHRKISEWYFYDLNYWGLDYPPLTAYHSWILSRIGRLINPSFVELRPANLSDPTGWGDLHDGLKLFLRWTVIGSDLIFWIPIVFLYRSVTHIAHRPKLEVSSDHGIPGLPIRKKNDWNPWIHSSLLILLNPNLILIDNGHFQFNSIMLGLTLGSVISFHLDHHLLGAALYVCSMCFKQMAIYYSPAIFAYLFGKCLFERHSTGFASFIKIAIVSTLTLVSIFLPLMIFAPFPDTILQAIHRIFPIARGLFEDKVANFWCATNVLIKFRTLASVTTLAKVALLMTFLAVLPVMLVMIWVSWNLGSIKLADHHHTPQKPGVGGGKVLRSVNLLPYSLFSASMAFYLFSFQVHEKTILLPILPLLMIMGRHYDLGNQFDFNHDWEWSCLVSNVACFSMWPLLKKDGLSWQYGTMTLLYNYVIGYNPFRVIDYHRSGVDYLAIVTHVLMGLIHLSEMIISPPDRLPDLYIVLNLSLSFSIFGLSYLWSLLRLVEEGWGLIGFNHTMEKKKTHSTASSSSPTTTGKPEVPSQPSTLSRLAPRNEIIRSTEPGSILMEDEVERDPSKNKRASSLQARPKKPVHYGLSDDEPITSRSRSVGGIIRQSGNHQKPRAMISTPGAEKLINRIRNRVNSDHVNGSHHRLKMSRVGSTGPQIVQKNRLLNHSQPDLSVEAPIVENSPPIPAPSSTGIFEAPIVENSPPIPAPSSTSRLNDGDDDDDEGQRISRCREEEGEGSMGGGTKKIEVVEQDWETALRQSREGAILRRREELRLSGKVGVKAVTSPGGGGGGFVDALDLVNGPIRR